MSEKKNDAYAQMAKDPLVQWIEKGNHRLFRKIYKFLLNRYYIDTFYCKVAKGAKTLSEVLHKRVELGILDRSTYLIAKGTTKFSQKFRKIQTGVLRWNMVLALVGGGVLMLVLALHFGEIL